MALVSSATREKEENKSTRRRVARLTTVLETKTRAPAVSSGLGEKRKDPATKTMMMKKKKKKKKKKREKIKREGGRWQTPAENKTVSLSL